MIDKAIVEVEDEIMTIEGELAEMEERLAYLESDDYAPEQNPDHEYKESDIVFCEDEIAGLSRTLQKLKRIQTEK